MTINEWLEISEMSGKGNAKVTLTAPSYEYGETRTLQLAVKGRYGTKYVNIRQDSKEEILVNQYLWVLLEEEGEISGIKSSTIQYSYDRESWTSFPANGSITVPANTYVWFKNTSEDLNYSFEETVMNVIRFSVKGSVGGDLSSMGNMKRGNFESLFYINENLTDASKLILPWAVLEVGCYKYMFRGCNSLVNAPELPATTLAENCYDSMFEYCTSLETAPELPATTLAKRCYLQMFENCTSLTTAPELPATTLVTRCYEWMFYNCSNLNYIKMLATDIDAVACLSNWVKGVAPTGTFVKHPNMNDLTIGVNGIPEGWVVMNEGGGESDDDDDDVNNAYFWVEFEEEGGGIKFNNEYSSLVNGWELDFSYSFDGVTWQDLIVGQGTIIELNENKKIYLYNHSRHLGGYRDDINIRIEFMNKYCSIGGNILALSNMMDYAFVQTFRRNPYLKDASRLILPTEVGSHTYYSTFNSCVSLKKAPQLPSTELAEFCYADMFSNCISLETAPELLSTTLSDSCYFLMFAKCYSLSYIKMLGYNTKTNKDGEIPTLEDCLMGWVGNFSLQDIGNAGGTFDSAFGVSPTGTFVKHPNAELSFSEDGIPEGWTVIDA